jgi:hypothetical protein
MEQLVLHRQDVLEGTIVAEVLLLEPGLLLLGQGPEQVPHDHVVIGPFSIHARSIPLLHDLGANPFPAPLSQASMQR